MWNMLNDLFGEGEHSRSDSNGFGERQRKRRRKGARGGGRRLTYYRSNLEPLENRALLSVAPGSSAAVDASVGAMIQTQVASLATATATSLNDALALNRNLAELAGQLSVQASTDFSGSI